MGKSTSCLKFVVDECFLPAKWVDAINFASKRLPNPFFVCCLTLDERGTGDEAWIKKRIAGNYVIITADVAMISDHDIASLVEHHQGIMFLLKPEVSQQSRWDLLRWLVQGLPKIASTASRSKAGSTWLVNKSVGFNAVEPRAKSETLAVH